MDLSDDSNGGNPAWAHSDSESIQEIEETEGISKIPERADSHPKGGSAKRQPKKLYLECPNKCGSVFFYRHTLNRHLEFVCLQEPRYKCPYCSLCCKQQWNLLRHVKHRHPHRSIYAIDIMRGKPVQLSGSNSEPVKIIHNEGMESGIKISSVASLVNNESVQPHAPQVRKVVKNVMKRDKPFPCPNMCGSSYKNIRSMRAHVEFECGQSPRFRCPYCTRYSKYSRNILTHVKLLHPEKECYSIDVVTKKTFGNIKKSSKKKMLAAPSSMT